MRSTMIPSDSASGSPAWSSAASSWLKSSTSRLRTRRPAAEDGIARFEETAQRGEGRGAANREDVKPLALQFLAGGVGVGGGQPEPPQVARGFADLAEEFGHLRGPRMVNVRGRTVLFSAPDR